jgi:hypothetical protein
MDAQPRQRRGGPGDLVTREQRRIFEDAMAVIEEATEESAESIRRAIWNRWEADKIGSATASRLLTELALKLSGGPGLTHILADGSQEPMRL